MNPTNEPSQEPALTPEVAPAPETPVTPGASNVHLESKKPAKKWPLYLLLVVILAVGGYFGYRWWHNNHATKTATAVVVKKDIPLIRYALVDGPANNFYPNPDTSNGGFFINAQTSEGLVGYQDGTKIVPLLATGWTNPDDSTWVFNLRSNVKFHTGRTMTATDVKTSIEKYKDTVYGGEFGTTIKSVEAVTPTQIKIVTDGPDPILLHRLVYLNIIDSQSTKVNDAINGTGPYLVKTGTDPSKDAAVDLVAFDDYWGGHIYTRELQVSVLSAETDAIALFKDHKLDLMDSFLKTSNAQAARDVGAIVTADQSATVSLIGLNTTIAPLNNPKLRQALDIGLDRTAIFKANQQTGDPIGQFVVRTVPGYDPSIAAPTLDLAKAKQLVADSGVKNPTFTLTYAKDNQSAAVEIQKEAAAFGVTITLDPKDSVGDLIDLAFSGKGQAFSLGFSSDLNDASDAYTQLFQNKNYNSDAVAALLTTANKQLNASQRIATLQQIAKILHTDIPGIALASRTEYYASAHSDYALHRDLPTSTIGIYFWKVYQR